MSAASSPAGPRSRHGNAMSLASGSRVQSGAARGSMRAREMARSAAMTRRTAARRDVKEEGRRKKEDGGGSVSGGRVPGLPTNFECSWDWAS